MQQPAWTRADAEPIERSALVPTPQAMAVRYWHAPDGGRAVHGDPHVGIRSRPAQWSRGHEPSSAAAQSSSVRVTEITDLGHASILIRLDLVERRNTDVNATFTHTSMGPSSASILEVALSIWFASVTSVAPPRRPRRNDGHPRLQLPDRPDPERSASPGNRDGQTHVPPPDRSHRRPR